VPVEFVTDFGPLIEQLETGYAQAEPRLDGLLKYVRQELRTLHAKVFWVSTDKMRADRQTNKAQASEGQRN